MTNERKPLPNMRELGTSGLKRFSGYVFEEYLRELQGERWRKTIAEMEYDPIVGASLLAIDMMIRRVKWTVKPASESAEDKTIAEFVDSCLNDMSQPWNETVSEILTMLPYGWSWFEVVNKRREGQRGVGYENEGKASSMYADGKIGWRKWAIRGQDSLFRWEFDDTGNVLGMWQMAPPLYQLVLIPIEKSLLFRTTSRKGNPEGRSVLRSAYRAWYMKKNIENIEGIGIERDLAGLPMAMVPPELLGSAATAEQKELLAVVKDIVRNVRRDEQEGIVWPMAYDENGQLLYDFKLLSTGGGRQFDTNTIIGRYDQRIAMSMMTDLILMGHENVGSFSMSESKSDLLIASLDARLDSIGDVVSRYAFPRLLRLNGWVNAKSPTLEHSEIAKASLTELGTYLTQLSGAGMALFPDEALEAHLRQQAELPEASGTAISAMEAAMMQQEAANKQADKQQANDAKQQNSKKASEYGADEQEAMVQAATRLLMRGA